MGLNSEGDILEYLYILKGSIPGGNKNGGLDIGRVRYLEGLHKSGMINQVFHELPSDAGTVVHLLVFAYYLAIKDLEY